jgi:hypothetical protein
MVLFRRVDYATEVENSTGVVRGVLSNGAVPD